MSFLKNIAFCLQQPTNHKHRLLMMFLSSFLPLRSKLFVWYSLSKINDLLTSVVCIYSETVLSYHCTSPMTDFPLCWHCFFTSFRTSESWWQALGLSREQRLQWHKLHSNPPTQHFLFPTGRSSEMSGYQEALYNETGCQQFRLSEPASSSLKTWSLKKALPYVWIERPLYWNTIASTLQI